MLLDHIGAGLFPSQIWWRIVGRLAFPIFAFLICEGYFHTRAFKRYAIRLGIFAIISEIPFNLLHSDHIFDMEAQNIFFTLLIGLLTIYGFEKFAAKSDKQLPPDDAHNLENRVRTTNFAQIAIAAAGLLAANFARVDYGAFGVAVILIFYLFRDKRNLALIFSAAANLALGAIDFANGFVPLQALAGIAAIPLFFYNGEKGPSAKFAFYAFYPIHIAIIMAIKYIIFELPFSIWQ